MLKRENHEQYEKSSENLESMNNMKIMNNHELFSWLHVYSHKT